MLLQLIIEYDHKFISTHVGTLNVGKLQNTLSSSEYVWCQQVAAGFPNYEVAFTRDRRKKFPGKMPLYIFRGNLYKL